MMRLTLCATALIAACSGAPQQRAWPPVGELPPRAELPDPLLTFDGRRVTSADQWVRERRPELKALFQHYMYGHLIPRTGGAPAKVQRIDAHFFGGKATKKEVTVALSDRADGRKLEMLLVVPNKRSGPAPVFVGHNFSGNHTLVTDPGVSVGKNWMRRGDAVVDNRATEQGRGKNVATWSLEQSIDRGYAVATFYYGDVFPDQPNFADGVYPEYFTPQPGQKSPGDIGPGAIAMWAWGIHRAVDYLVTDKDLDPKRIAAVGHSRLGKTALLAAAMDERIALAIPHQAGCGGTAPSRTKNPKAETVKVINRAFPHWFCDNFKKFDDQVDRLPFDQNCLVALCAPRPVLYTNAEEDQWADPGGQLDMLRSADAVYRLLGAEGLAAKEMPQHGKLVDSPLGYFIRLGKHSMTPEDWKVFLDFADKHFKR